MADCNILDYGAVNDSSTLCTSAIQTAIDACHEAGGGRVIVPAPGTYLSGMLTLKTNVELHVEQGATLTASGDPDHYAPMDTTPEQAAKGYPTFRENYFRFGFITALSAENISITGFGTIDGGGRHFIKERREHIYVMQQKRPHTVFLIDCKRITIRDVTITDGATWTIRTNGCDDIVIHGIRMYNDMLLPNNDGIDLDNSRNARISDCYLECGDDCIVMKTTNVMGEFGPCENITVTGCTLVSKSFALNIGCETHAPMRDMVFDSLVVKSSHRGVGIHLSHECDVENIIFSNMVIETQFYDGSWWGRAEPLYVVAVPWTDEDTVGVVRNIRFSNILCRGENGVHVYGWEPDRIVDLVFDNVRMEINKTTDWPAGFQDMRPWPGEDFPEHHVSGFLLKNATKVTLRDCAVHWGENLVDDYRYALDTDTIKGLRMIRFEGEAAHPDRDGALHLQNTDIIE